MKTSTLTVKKYGQGVRLSLPNDLNGEVIVILTTDPETLIPEKEILVNFSKGVAILNEISWEKRYFFITKIAQVQYIGATRRLEIDSLFNCRDLGGYPTVTGQTVRWGMLYRSDALDHLTAIDQAVLRSLKMTTVIDLRSSKEIQHRPDKEIGEAFHYHFDPHADVAKKAGETPQLGTKDEEKVRRLEKLAETKAGQAQLVAMKKQMVAQMEALVISSEAQKAYRDMLASIKRGELPLLFHCQGGKDRTGWGAAIILGLLGVSVELIYYDYRLTEQYNRPRNEARMAIYRHYTQNSFVLDYLASLQRTTDAYLDSAFQAVNNHFGSMENYAATVLDFSVADQNEMKKRLLL